ncbi:autotransporter outer membrane beta-barrel domain-containing protein [Ralstonia sp.]|uniref:autotransporter outer membrane beta-barrel domain-containing protein n=1 Tax=Ralstonia sp. TaxID=54061 RepID=UPI0031E15BD1
MNHVFRIVWSKSLGTWVVASELTAGRGKSSGEKRRSRALVAGISVGVMALCGWSASASAQVWKGTTSTDWTVGSNWSTGTAPAANATVTINTNSPNPAVLGASGAATSTIGALQLGTATGTSALTIQNGSTLSATSTATNSMIGNFAGANATLTVTGAGSSWSVAGITNVGNAGTGTLNIANGGAVSATNALGLAFGSGAGTGTLNVTSGGTLTTNNAAIRNGTGNVSGAGSLWNAGSLLAIGTTNGLSGTLNVQSGGVVTATGNINIGAQNISNRTAVGTATVTGAGSQLTTSAALNIGLGGQGTLTVSNGAVATANSVNMATGGTGNSTLNLSSAGTLATGALAAGAGTAQANFDNATLRATASNTTFINGFNATGLNIAAGGLTLDSGAFNVTVVSPFSGGGALTKTGTGTAVFTGNNTYAGGTAISAGTLQLGNGGTSGSIVGNVTNNGTLAFDRSDTVSFAGQISGAGAVKQIGTGTTVLSGTNTYAGGTSITAGTLQVSADANLGNASGGLTVDGGTLSNTAAFTSARAVTLGTNGGTLDTEANLSLSGTIGGTGALTKTGTGTLTLTGSNAYAGGTFLNAGTVAVSSDANLGSASGALSFNGGTLQNTANVASARAVMLNVGGGTFQTTGNLTLSGAIGGAGALTKTDAGTLLLTGNNSYTGGTTIAAGTLQLGNGGTSGSITGDVTNNGALVFSRSDSVTFGGAISGSGSVTQAGAGTTVLSGANAYTGTTTVQAGTLLVDGNQAGATGLTTVQSGATLGGTGTLGGNVTVASGGTLSPGNAGAVGALTVNGNLTLNNGAALNYQFGQANTPGGALNDLTTVNGNLTLAGTLNVSASPGGTFGPGVYRIFNYGGTLANNGLAIGTAPAGTYYVQTSVANQVNLVNSTGVALSFWDGAAGPKNNGAINGGNGTWQNGAGNDNWADNTGTINAPYANGTFAVFQGTPGTVTVDNSLGNVTTSGMQFATNGYTVTGNPLTLTGASNIIRVGDGTSAGTGMTATIDAVLAGTGGLQKTDLGTLVLNGANTYTGGTTIQAGTLRVSSDANLGAAAGGLTIGDGALQNTASMTSARSVALTGAGNVLTDPGTTLTLAGSISGAGSLTKAGTGTLLLQGADTHTGDTHVSAGTLKAGAAQAFSAASAYAVDSGATLDLNGFQQTLKTLTNAGTVNVSGNGAALTVAGNYTGNGGTVQLRSALGGDNSVTDRLVVQGDTAGTTTLKVSNVGGAGAQTVNGIKVVDVGGQSAGTFALQGDYTFKGQQAVIGGAYAYTLQKNGISTPTDGDWYLRSSLINPVSAPTSSAAPAGPLYQPGVPLYEAYSQVLLAMNDLPTLQQRVGGRYWAERATGADADAGGDEAAVRPGAGWAHIEGRRLAVDSPHSSTGTQWNLDQVKTQAGLDTLLTENAAGRLFAGIGTQYSHGRAGIDSFFGNGTISVDGYSLSGSATWAGNNGFYVDGQAQATWYNSNLTSDTIGRRMTSDNKGFGRAFSIESGQRVALNEAWSVTPQAQLVYSSVSFDDFTDPFGAHVTRDKADSLTSRLGVSLDYNTAWRDAAGHAARANVYGLTNLYYDFRGGTTVNVSDTLLSARADRLWAGVGVGGSVTWNDGRYGLYGQLLMRSSLEGTGSGHDYRANVGVRVRW